MPAVYLRLFSFVLLCTLSAQSEAVPSFARQTGMACAACHTVFPELTPFGREFKLNGYVLDNIKQITGIDTSNRQTLAINSLPPVSMMLQVSYTHTAAALPDSALTGALAKDGDVLFPDQLSLFYAGKIADELGAFVQLTYDGAADHFAIDNTDIRYAHHLSFGGANDNGHSLILGVSGCLEHDPCLGLSVRRQRRSARTERSNPNRRSIGPECCRPGGLRVARRSFLCGIDRIHCGDRGGRTPTR
jgi:hypothetical protein